MSYLRGTNKPSSFLANCQIQMQFKPLPDHWTIVGISMNGYPFLEMALHSLVAIGTEEALAVVKHAAKSDVPEIRNEAAELSELP